MFSMMQTATSQLTCWFMTDVLPCTAFLIAAFSALRLGKFNIDTRQKTSFIGLPTPSNAIFISSFAVCYQDASVSVWALLAIVVVFSWLLVAEIPMFSLKLKNLTWRDNSTRYVFLAGCVVLVLLLGVSHLYALIVWYILLSLATWCLAKKTARYEKLLTNPGAVMDIRMTVVKPETNMNKTTQIRVTGNGPEMFAVISQHAMR